MLVAGVDPIPVACRTITRLRQTVAHRDERPHGAPPGDCYRTALACLLGLHDPLEVPHFVELTDDMPRPGWEVTRLTRRWLQEVHGLDLLVVDRVEADGWDGVPYMATVWSQRGPWSHAVVGQAGEVIHDPSGLDTYRFDLHGITSPAWMGDTTAGDPAEVLVEPFLPGPDEQVDGWIREAAS